MIEVERGPAEGVTVLRLSRPPVNALDIELVGRIAAAIEDALADGAPALVLTGRGGSFSAGIDVKLAPTYTDEQRRTAIRGINAMVAVVHGAPAPVVAAINGHALGGGLVLALACDMRVASRGEYKLALNEVAAGVPFPAGPLALVRAELEPSVVRDLCLSGRMVGPEEALALRVVDELAEDDELIARACERAAALASMSAYATVKRQLRGELSARLARIAAEDEDPLLRAGA
jgi:enoyl-CoA hydratase